MQSMSSSYHVGDVPVYPAIRYNTHKMSGSTSCLQTFDKVSKTGIFGKTAFFNCKINLPQVHCNDATSANIRMPDFRVSHLPARQPDVGAKGCQCCIGAFRHKPVHCRRFGEKWRIAFHLRAQTPAVQNTKYNWFWRAHVLLSLLGLAIF